MNCTNRDCTNVATSIWNSEPVCEECKDALAEEEAQYFDYYEDDRDDKYGHAWIGVE